MPFLKTIEGDSSFDVEFKIDFLLDWLLTKVREPKLLFYFIHSLFGKEKDSSFSQGHLCKARTLSEIRASQKINVLHKKIIEETHQIWSM